MKPKVFLLGLKESWNFDFIHNCNAIIVCTKVQRFSITQNGGMVGEDDVNCEITKMTSLIRKKTMFIAGNPLYRLVV